jgi:PAS domain S-box-containing protein
MVVTDSFSPIGADPSPARAIAAANVDPIDDLARFARTVSHDFSSPLLAIRCFATLLIDGLSGVIDDEKSGYLREIVTSAERMQALNEGLVTWVRARQSDLTFVDVSLHDVVSECLEDLAPRIERQSAVVTLSALPVMRADEKAMRFVVYQLIDNALRYAYADRVPHIHIGATHSDGDVKIVVHDDGIGISDANLVRVFGLFARIDPGRDPGRPGVGLTISRTMVERHGGRLCVGAASGGGTDATFTIPVVSEALGTSRAGDARDAPGRTLGTAHLSSGDAEALAAIVEFADDAIFSTDLAGQITTWNRGAEALYGYTRCEAVGRQAAMLLTPERLTELDIQLATRRTGEATHLDATQVRSDGRRIDVSVTSSPIRDHRGELVGASIVARDATARHQAEEQLRALLEVPPDAVVIIDPDGTINAVNTQATSTFGYPASEMVGQPVEMLIPERFRGQHRLAFTASPAQRPMGTGLESYGRRSDGSEFPVYVQLSTIPTRNGRRPVAAIRDITEHVRLERLRDDFIGNAAHELRTPLTTLAGLGETLAKSYDVMARDDIEAAFAAMARQGARARVLIANLLDLSNIEGGRADFIITNFALAPLVDGVLESTPPPEGKAVSKAVARGLSVRFDSGRLEQVISNLLVNAYRYGGPTIRVEAEEQDEMVMLSVSDDGPGVASDFVVQLFEPFTRGKQSNGVRGSGIGLALCRRIVRSMDGDIWYEPRSPRGATFRISLPRLS